MYNHAVSVTLLFSLVSLLLTPFSSSFPLFVFFFHHLLVPPDIEASVQMTFVTDPGTVIGISQSNVVYVSPGLAFCIECIESVGYPESELYFRRNDRLINFRDPRLFRNDSRLCFREITASYNGQFSCIAGNDVGQDREYVQITVGGKRKGSLHRYHASHSLKPFMVSSCMDRQTISHRP